MCLYTYNFVNYIYLNKTDGERGPFVLVCEKPYYFIFSPLETLFWFYGPQENFKIDYIEAAALWAFESNKAS